MASEPLFVKVAATAQRMKEMLASVPDATIIPVEDFGWENTIWRSQKFRRAHVEIFRNGVIMVLHVTVFPHVHDPCPIYGFDIVTGPEKAAGAFLDRTPTTENWSPSVVATYPFKDRKKLPEWASIFSDKFLAIRPVDHEEMDEVLALAERALASYLAVVGGIRMNYPKIAEAQNAYCLGQRQNAKTMQILERMLGPERARYFMDEVLFPLV